MRMVDAVTAADAILIQLRNCKAGQREQKEGGGGTGRGRE